MSTCSSTSFAETKSSSSPSSTTASFPSSSTASGRETNAVHCVQANTPARNILGMLDVVKEINGVR
jgi:hypothetical protein